MNNDFLTFLNIHPRHRNARAAKPSRGQSLVELGLTLPVLLLIVAGTVEVTNMLTLYNEVQLAAREAARFASQGGPDDAVMTVVKQSFVDTPVKVEHAELNVWVIRPVLDTPGTSCTGSGCDGWIWQGGSKTAWGVTETCIYPIPTTPPTTPSTCDGNSPVTAEKVGKEMMQIKNDSHDGQRFVVVVIKYRAQTLLNMKSFGTVDGRFPLYAYAILRQEVDAQTSNQLTAGCSAYPIAIADIQIPPTEGMLTEPLKRNNLSDAPPPDWDGFGFLLWRDVANGITALNGGVNNGSLWFPGTSDDYQDPDGSGNTQLRRGDRVLANPAPTVSDANANIPNILLQRYSDIGHSSKWYKLALRAIVYTYDSSVGGSPASFLFPPPTGPGTRYQYLITGFVVVRIKFFDTANDTITFEFVRWDSSCGFTA